MTKPKKEYSNTPEVKNTQINELDQSETFMIVNVDDKWRIGIAGRWVTKNVFESKEKAQEYINSKPWEIIANYAAILAEYIYKELNKQNQERLWHSK